MPLEKIKGTRLKNTPQRSVLKVLLEAISKKSFAQSLC